VDTIELLAFVSAIVPTPLVEECVNGDGGLAGLTVTAHGTIASIGLRPEHGLVDGTAGDNAVSFDRGTAAFRRLDGSLAIDGVAEGVNDVDFLVYPIQPARGGGCCGSPRKVRIGEEQVNVLG
jgi:hypothetical protein